MAKFNWQRQHIILTGAAGGLGEQLAEQLSALGAKVLLLGRTERSMQDLAQRLQQPYLTADVTDALGQQQLLDYVELWQHTKTPVTGLINNAAINSAGMLCQQSTTDIAQVIQVNLTAPMQLSALVMPFLDPQQGWILNVGSVFGSIGYPGQSLYCAAKFGLRGFTQALQRELGATSIRVMYCAPRAIATGLNDPLTAAMNAATGSAVDSAGAVASKIVRQIANAKPHQVLGWPEKFFVWLNGAMPGLVASSMSAPRKILYRLTQELGK